MWSREILSDTPLQGSSSVRGVPGTREMLTAPAICPQGFPGGVRPPVVPVRTQEIFDTLARFGKVENTSNAQFCTRSRYSPTSSESKPGFTLGVCGDQCGTFSTLSLFSQILQKKKHKWLVFVTQQSYLAQIWPRDPTHT